MENALAGRSGIALCVDLDGTLLRGDILYESFLALLRSNFLYAFLVPLWLLRGKAALKHEIARRVELNPADLPYDERVIDLLRRTSDRPRVLCTATNVRHARVIAEHLGLFEEVLASDATTNLSGDRKARALVERFGEKGFDYAGNELLDTRIWAKSRAAWVVNGPESLLRQAGRLGDVAGHFPREGGVAKAWIRQLRIHQWLKNLLVLVPLFAAHRFTDPAAVTNAAIAFLAFGLCASGVYVLNDLLDLPSDRAHPRKRMRPFASGRLPLLHGLIAAPLLTLAGFALAFAVSRWLALVLCLYYSMTLVYSFRLKQVVMLDVVVLAGLYTIRIIGGAAAIGVAPSFWLLAFSMFVFLSLAMLKRYTELTDMVSAGISRAAGRGYEARDLPLMLAMGPAAGYLSVLVFALYINSPSSVELYSRPWVLWLICPLLLFWISRAWIIAHRGGMHDDPIVFAVSDRVSLGVVALCGALVLGAV
jgi:4-hydroxybenzoate polyprenyltransferase